MKFILFIIAIIFSQILHSQIVDIPDANFKNALLNHSPTIDLNGDDEIQVSEAESFTGFLNLYSKNISSLTGIEAFTNITQLDCSRNYLTYLFLRFNTNLVHLDCEWNDIIDLEISYNTALETLNSSNNYLSELNVSNNIELREIRSSNNLLTNEWFGNCPLLSYLDISYNQIYDIELRYNPLLSELYCYANQLTNINTSSNTNLTIFDCTENHLTNLDVTNNLQLTRLWFSENQLTNIDVSNNSALIQISCAQNNLKSLDLSNNPNLIVLWCHYNELIELDLSNNPNFTYLWCNNNEFLNYINLKNGNNQFFNNSSHLNNLPNLETVCVDDINYQPLIDFILNQVNHNVTFTENCELSINENNLYNVVSLYPNPTSGLLHISFKNHEFEKIELFNTIGQLMISKSILNNEPFINLSDLSDGFYILKLINKSGERQIFNILKN